ncbi:glycoside hydrolase family 15 protein, partial [Kitasatospora sp. NPDC098663]|uniref:glycoside hydrolase family 15 protein n=1 Tax=Kitasatospora sp. NPDC098663 TaxID=3364096 RepID=UPI00380EAB28
FTQYYGSRDLDASLLLIPVVGFLPGDDKRVIRTVEAVQRELASPDGLVHRYPTGGRRANVDGLTGHEGAFLACSFWLVDALGAIGQGREARALLDRLLALRNDLGLLAEEYDPLTRRQLGNFPQAFSMWALADSCRALSTFSAFSARADVGSRIPCPDSVSDVQPAQNSVPTHEPAGEAALSGAAAAHEPRKWIRRRYEGTDTPGGTSVESVGQSGATGQSSAEPTADVSVPPSLPIPKTPSLNATPAQGT